MAITLIYVIVYSSERINKKEAHELIKYIDFFNIPFAIGIALSSMSFAGIFFDIRYNMENPSSMKKLIKYN